MKLPQRLKEYFLNRVENYLQWCIAMIMDGLFLSLWLLLQRLPSYLYTERLFTRASTTEASITRLSVSENLHFITYDLFNFLFAIATLIPVILFIYKDIRLLWYRTNQEIKNQKK